MEIIPGDTWTTRARTSSTSCALNYNPVHTLRKTCIVNLYAWVDDANWMCVHKTMTTFRPSLLLISPSPPLPFHTPSPFTESVRILKVGIYWTAARKFSTQKIRAYIYNMHELSLWIRLISLKYGNLISLSDFSRICFFCHGIAVLKFNEYA